MQNDSDGSDDKKERPENRITMLVRIVRKETVSLALHMKIEWIFVTIAGVVIALFGAGISVARHLPQLNPALVTVSGCVLLFVLIGCLYWIVSVVERAIFRVYWTRHPETVGRP